MAWTWLYRVFCAGVLAFLLVPIAAIVPLSFSSGSFLTYPLPGLSLRWYAEVLSGGKWLTALANSLFVGSAATVASVSLGTLAALGLARQRGPLVAALKLLMLSPMIVPVILVAVGSYFFLAPLSLTSSYAGLILAHTVMGQGISYMADDFRWHGKPPKMDQAEVALKELGTSYAEWSARLLGN